MNCPSLRLKVLCGELAFSTSSSLLQVLLLQTRKAFLEARPASYPRPGKVHRAHFRGQLRCIDAPNVSLDYAKFVLKSSKHIDTLTIQLSVMIGYSARSSTHQIIVSRAANNPRVAYRPFHSQ